MILQVNRNRTVSVFHSLCFSNKLMKALTFVTAEFSFSRSLIATHYQEIFSESNQKYY